MSEVKGQLLGIVLVLSIFAGLVATVTTITSSLETAANQKFSEIEDDLTGSAAAMSLLSYWDE